MIIVAGALYVDIDGREEYLAGCVPVVNAARTADGCLDFAITADLVDPTRINVFERWESTEAVERFRGSGPSSDQQTAIRDAEVVQYEVSAHERL